MPSLMFTAYGFYIRPCLSSCILGTLNIGIALGIHPATGSPWPASAITAIVLALVSTVIYAALSFLTHHKISNVRARDPLRRTRTNSEAANLITEDDRVQKQLLGLLQQKDADKTSPDASQSTFRIDIPENSKVSKGARNTASYLAAPSNIYESRNRSNDASAIEEQFSLMRGAVQETVPIDRKLQALERARAKSQQSRSRDVSQGPPIIVNTRQVDDIEEIPLSERHPLERGGGFIRGRTSKDEPYTAEGVYRPEDEDHSYDVDAIAEVRRPEVELEDSQRGRRQHPQLRGELEAGAIPRIVRVQTDGWPGS